MLTRFMRTGASLGPFEPKRPFNLPSMGLAPPRPLHCITTFDCIVAFATAVCNAKMIRSVARRQRRCDIDGREKGMGSRGGALFSATLDECFPRERAGGTGEDAG